MDGNECVNKVAGEAAAFQRIWVETMSRIAQAAFTISPESTPPEMVRQVRTGIFQALAASWDEFMRSPQFLEGMRQWTENALVFRNLSNDFLARVRTELQAPSREDIDSVMLTVRHMEKRLLDRVDELSAEVKALKAQAGPCRQSKGSPAARRGGRVKGNGKLLKA